MLKNSFTERLEQRNMADKFYSVKYETQDCIETVETKVADFFRMFRTSLHHGNYKNNKNYIVQI